MLTTTETVLFITVWSLTGVGLFFGTRAKLRRRREKKTSNPAENRTDSSS